MNSKLPCVAKCFDHFGFLSQILVLAICDIPLVDKRLEIRSVFDTVRRVNI